MDVEDITFWNDMFDDTEKVALSTKYLQQYAVGLWTARDFCFDYKGRTARSTASKYEVWLGEWSLSTDTCAHWLGGFNNGASDYYSFACNWDDCPRSYLPS